jgi:hypothetical protein
MVLEAARNITRLLADCRAWNLAAAMISRQCLRHSRIPANPASADRRRRCAFIVRFLTVRAVSLLWSRRR